MEFATKSKSLKGVSKLINKAFALIVSVCMVCTLTPAAAWASGASASGTEDFVGSNDGTASASSVVNAIIKDVNFEFIGGITFGNGDAVDGTNYQSVQKLGEDISQKQLKATFKGEGLPDKFSITWYITEYAWDSQTQKYVQKGEEQSLPGQTPGDIEKSTLSSNSDGDYNFYYPKTAGGSGSSVSLSGVEEGKCYELSVMLQDKTSEGSAEGGESGESTELDSTKSAKASAMVTIFIDYSSQKLLAEGQPEISATGSFYVNGTVGSWTYPILEATDASSDISVTKMNNAALNQSTAEQVVEGTQLTLTNTSEEHEPYTGTLEVAIPLPLASDGGVNGYSVREDENGKPVVSGPNGAVASVNVYTCDKSGTITSPTTTITWATDASGNYITNDNGKIAVAVFSVSGTGTELGVFGVGVPLKSNQQETFNVETTVEGPGIISPSPATVSEQEGAETTTSEGATLKQVLGTAQTYSAYAVSPGYVFRGFTMKVAGTDTSIIPSDLGYNTFTLNSSNYANIGTNSTVEICATFAKQESSGTAKTLTVNLNTEDGATGDLTMQLIGGAAEANSSDSNNESKTVFMGSHDTLSISAGKGAMLNFRPGNDPATCKVMSVSVDGKDMAVQGNSLMLSAINNNTTVDVVYEVGMPAFVFTNAVKVHIDADQNNSGYQPSYVTTSDTSEPEHTYGQSCGSSLTIYTKNDRDYDLLRVVITKTDGSKVTFESKDPDVIEGVELVEASEDLASIAKTYNDYANSEIVIYNIVDVLDVELTYNYASVSISVEPGEGSSVEWGEPTTSNNANSLLKSNFVANKTSVGSFLEKAYADEPNEGQESGTLKSLGVNEQMQIKIWVGEGYAINNVTLNSQSVTNFLTKRDAVNEDGDILYTFTVYRGGSIGAATGFDYNGDGVEDRVYYLQGRVTGGLTLTVETSPVIIPQKADCYVSTSVSSFGHGKISDSKKVASGSPVQIQFFPDEGYTVDKVTVGDDTVTYGESTETYQWMSNVLGIEFTIDKTVQAVQVEVTFKPGDTPSGTETTKYTVSATAGAGGTISPSGTYSVYKGTTETFTITPSTGYEISTLRVNNGDDIKSEISSSSTFTCDPINDNTNVVVTFQKKDSAASDTYQVSATKSGEGTVSPSGPISVGAGSDMTFTIIPKYENDGDKWYISDVRAKYRGSDGEFDAKGMSVISFLENNFTLTLPDIQSDTILEVTFEQSTDGTNRITGGEIPNPNGSDTEQLVLSSDAIEVVSSSSASTAPGAIVTPSLDDMYLIKDNVTGGIKGSLNLTINVASGYKLVEPFYPTTDKDGGIYITTQGGKTSPLYEDENSYTVTKVSDGVYNVSIPGKYVNENFHMRVTTEPITSSTSEVALQTITLETEGSGTISPGGTGTENILQVENGKSQTFSFIPDSNYKLKDVYIDGEKVNISGNLYTIPAVRSDMTIKAVFVKADGETQPTTHEISIEYRGDNRGGVCAPSGKLTVIHGGNLTITAVPKEDYKVTTAQSVPTSNLGAEPTNLVRSGNSFELTNITENTTVYVTFELDVQRIYYNFTVKSSGPGKTTPTGTQLVSEGSNQTVVLKPDDGCYVKSVTVTESGVPQEIEIDSVTMTLPLSVTSNTSVDVVYTNNSGEVDKGLKDLPAGNDSASRFKLTASVVDGKGGVITPASVSVAGGSNFTFNITPYNGYEIKHVYDYVNENNKAVDISGQVSNGALTLLGIDEDQGIRENHDIQVEFESIDTSTVADDYYTVFVSVVKIGGKVSQAGYNVVPGGGSLPLSLIPEPGYKVSTIAIDNGTSNTPTLVTDITGNTYTLFNITEDKNVTVSFALLGTGETNKTPLTHKVVASSTLNGSVSQEGTLDIVDGANASFVFVPDSGYKLSYIVVDNNQIDAKCITNNQYTFVGVKSDHSISAVFCSEDDDSKYYTITANAGANGKVDPSGSNVVVKKPGEEIPRLSITASGYYGYKPSKIEIVYDNANRVEIDASTGVQTGTLSFATCEWNALTLTLSDISADLMVNAYFVKDEAKAAQISVEPDFTCVTVTSGAGGYTSMDGINYVENPKADWTEAEKYPSITVVPDEGKMVDAIEMVYGDGSRTVINSDGTTDYDVNGNVDGTTDSSQTSITVTQQGCFEYDAQKAARSSKAGSGKVNISVTFKDKLDGVNIPTYFEINATYSAGGRMSPSGTIKVAESQDVTIQLLPETGYEVSSLTIDGKDAMSKLTPTRKIKVEGTGNRSVNATFSYVSTPTYKVTASVVEGKSLGTVSPSRIDPVMTGESVTVNFYPKQENVKISELTVTKSDGTVVPTESPYTSSTYTFENIDSNYNLTVRYEEAQEGDTVLQYNGKELLTLTAKAGNTGGSATASTQEVPEGLSGTVYISPDAGYTLDYITFNDDSISLLSNATSYEATPVPDKKNEVVAYFKEVTAPENVIITPTIENGHATADPVIASVGSSISIIVRPDDGYTIDNVTIDGRNAAFGPADGTAKRDGAIYSSYAINVDSITKDTKVVITTRKISGSEEYINLNEHKLIIDGDNVQAEYFSETLLPKGGKKTINITPLPGCYLYSVIATYTGGGSENLTDQVTNGVLEFTMGDYDTSIFIKCLKVSDDKPDTVNVYLDTATLNGADILSRVEVGTSRNKNGVVTPIRRNTDGVLAKNDGQPMPFTQGEPHNFYVGGTNSDGKELVLVSATNNGESVICKNNELVNVSLDTDARLALVFRVAQSGETPGEPDPDDDTKQYRVWAEVANNTGGKVSPSEYTVEEGKNSNSFIFEPEDENYWMVEKVDIYYYDDAGNEFESLREENIDPSRYKGLTFKCEKVTHNTKVVVTFCEAVIVKVEWDNTQGYIMPNSSTGYLQIPKSYNNGKINFIVAPYVNYYVDSVTLASGKDSEAEDVTNSLKQGKEYAETLTGQGDGYSVVAVTEGGGVVTPYNDDGGNVTDGTSTQVKTESGEVVTAAFTSQSLNTLAETKDSESSGKTPTSKVFARAYGLTVPFNDDQDFELKASFYKSQTLEAFYKITAIAGEHGRIDFAGTSVDSTGSFDFTVAANSTPTFNFIADTGYTVSNIKLDGGPLDFGVTGEGGTSYTFSPVTADHTIEVEFAPMNGTTTGFDRFVKVASGLAKTGDLTGPVIGFFLIIAAVGVGVMAVSVIRRRRQETVRPRR